MQTYVITFSTVGIRDGWVEVTANSAAIVRAWANQEYVRWSSIYGPNDWSDETAAFFPLGRLGSTVLHYENADHVPSSRYQRVAR